jgi:outer membrane protein TolC
MFSIRRRFARRVIATLIVALPLSAGAGVDGVMSGQETGGDRLLLGDLYARVQRANPRGVAARALAGAAQARVPAAGRLPDPLVQLGLMNYDVPSLAPMPAIGMSQLQVMQMLPLGGKRSSATQVAASAAASAEARAQDVLWELRGAAAMAFYDLYAADRAIEVARETLRILEDVERTAESMYRLGGGRQADVLRAQVEIAKMAEDTIRMRAMRETMVARINALLDRDPLSRVVAAIPPSFPDVVPTRAWLDSIAESDRPMVRAGLEDVRAAEASERLARQEIWPDIQVGVQYGQRGGEMGTERMGSLMVGASIPIFARDRQLKMREEANAMTQMSRADLAAMRAETRGKIGEAYASLNRARSLARLYRTTVLPHAEAAVASAMSAYRVGGVDFMTLLDGRMSVNKYRQELYVLEADEGKAWAELEMLTGRQLFDPSQTSSVSAASRGDR